MFLGLPDPDQDTSINKKKTIKEKNVEKKPIFSASCQSLAKKSLDPDPHPSPDPDP